ncbi:MAG: PAS domain S-box protein [Myxococcales bacterium]|nr:PAS domain S-box protein [Myxococcales bacterium]MBP6845111.1 PAS domain S-box protein [Kofleriaceae bacterium]
MSPAASVPDRLHRLLESTARYTGAEFFAALARSVAELLDARIAFVGELTTPELIAVAASWVDGRPGEFSSYQLTGTPCAGVLGGRTCQYPADVQRQFPADLMLVELGIEAYFGVPIVATGGQAIGIIVALDRVSRAEIPGLDTLLGTAASRAAAEIERARAERALIDREARLRQLIETTMEGVWTIDEHNRTTLVNEQMARMLGYAPAAMLGRSMFDFMDERAQAEATANVERRKRGIGERHEFRLRHANGADVWVVMASTPLPPLDGRYAGALAMVTDVTERHNLELKVQHSQKLESLGVLAGGVAHDFNNLLVGILGNAGLAMMQLRPESPVAPLLKAIETAALRAADLTRQMLAYSGRGRFVIEPISLNGVIEEMVHLLGTVISKKAILRFELSPDLPVIDADATQIRQVLMNLVTNASDAIGDRSGVIAIRTGTVVVGLDELRDSYDQVLPEGTYVYCEVTDNGVGMDAATRARIFDPFFTTKFTGRGLGLAATLGILRGHHGAIHVDSAPGEGARFRVLLPARARSATVSSPAIVIAPPPATGHVLVVDDEAMIRDIASRVLESGGYHVTTANDGVDALRLFAERPDAFVCVLLDMTMPQLNGEETFAALRKLAPDVRVVLSSGYTEQEATQRFIGKGLAGFVAKPWSADELLAAIARATGDR